MQDRFFLSMETIDDHGAVVSSNTSSFTAEDLTELLANMTYFLNGCSYTYVEDLEAIKTGDRMTASTAPEQYSLDLGVSNYDPDDITYTFASA